MTANLKPVDFKAVAAKGAFVYCYLREDGTPYYVGKATTQYRPFSPHNVKLPSDRLRVRVMRSGLTEKEAFDWERFYIKHYGRKDNRTGILRNFTDGGEGPAGNRWTVEQKALLKASRNAWDAENKRWWGDKISAARKGHEVSWETREKIQDKLFDLELIKAAGLTVEQYRQLSSNAKAKVIRSVKAGAEVCPNHDRKVVEAARRRGLAVAQWAMLSELQRKHFSRTKKRADANGIPYMTWISLTKSEQIKLSLLAAA